MTHGVACPIGLLAGELGPVLFGELFSTR